MTAWCRLGAALLAAALTAPAVVAQESLVLFKDVRIFDGTGSALSAPSHVLVRGNLIERISLAPIELEDTSELQVIEGKQRTLMPGLIDVHTHLAMGTISQMTMMSSDANYATLISGQAATEMLMRGFTSARDAGGPVFGLKRAVDEGRIPGPRIWASGAIISQTSGHGDFRLLHELPRADGELHYSERLGYAAIADGEALVLRRVREQLMCGATQIKLTAGGGVSSVYDPLDVSQFSEAELRAAVQAASDWGTYVMVHAYTPQAVQTAVRAGVKSIEHGQLADEQTIKLMAEHDVWLSIQPFLGDPDPRFPEGSPGRLKQLMVAQGTENAIRLAKKHRVRIAWGVDILFHPAKAKNQGQQLSVMSHWFEPAEVLRMATSTNADLLALSGPRNPYPGQLGRVAEGALADLLVVDGDPLENLQLLDDAHNNIPVIMKDGRIYKNSL
ncbi:MAG: amidohydrolase family protein [Pseudomonas sp.]